MDIWTEKFLVSKSRGLPYQGLVVGIAFAKEDLPVP
jgi:hypothetical protein